VARNMLGLYPSGSGWAERFCSPPAVDLDLHAWEETVIALRCRLFERKFYLNTKKLSVRRWDAAAACSLLIRTDRNLA
jgi:hypothetical protein